MFLIQKPSRYEASGRLLQILSRVSSHVSFSLLKINAAMQASLTAIYLALHILSFILRVYLGMFLDISKISIQMNHNILNILKRL